MSIAFPPHLGHAFRAVAERHGERTALLYPASGQRVSYAQLLKLSEDLAAGLQRRGLLAGQVVVIFNDKSPAAYALMLACLRLGLIYTNLDPDSPIERMRKILDVCAAALLVNGFAQQSHADELAALANCPVVALPSLPEPAAEATADAPLCASAPAYIMFTSGSTGTPKGAVMSHANLMWFIAWSQERFAVSPDDVLTNANPMFFDNSVFDFYTALFSGACLVPLDAQQVRDTRTLVKLVNDGHCTIWFSVPSLLVYLLTTRALKSSDLPAMRKIIFGGEGFPKPKLKQLFDLFGHRAELENVYGPTECTCICSAYRIGPGDFEDMSALAPLGPLARNFAYELLPLEDGTPGWGELFLRGPQVGLGYYRDPGRTAAAFIQNPHRPEHIDVGYRSGDIVSLDADGRFHFRGRKDFQIKHMGYRIELEEIEFGLNTLPGVRECAAIYRRGPGGFGEIVAYVAADATAVAEDLLRRAATVLPQYMLPRSLVLLERLPKNANGKIDRTALHTSGGA